MRGSEAGTSLVAAQQQRGSVAENPQTRVDIQQLDEIPLTVQTGSLLLGALSRRRLVIFEAITEIVVVLGIGILIATPWKLMLGQTYRTTKRRGSTDGVSGAAAMTRRGTGNLYESGTGARPPRG
jgi:hypothetical protein